MVKKTIEMKQLIQKLIILTAMLSVSINTFAYDFEVDGIYYTIISLDDLTCGVASGDNEYSGDIVIPSSVKYSNMDFTVTRIEYQAFKNSNVTSVEIPSTISYIGNEAFYNSSLKYVEIPNSVTYLGTMAFYKSDIIRIEIPSSIGEIPKSCFNGCKNLSEVKIADGITLIDQNAFVGCISLETIEIPNSVKSIGYIEGSFKDCTNLKHISLGNSVSYIAERCFIGCNNLKTIDILNTEPPHQGSILGGDAVFQGITYLEAILNIPKGTLEAYKASELWGKFKNINEVFEPEAGVAELTTNKHIIVLTSNDSVIIKGASDAASIEVYNTSGQLIYSGSDTTINVPTKGIYIVRVGEETFKVSI